MVKDGFGVAGNDIAIGADILTRAALADANGAYFDNDSRQFGDPHPDALDPVTVTSVVDEIEVIVQRLVTAE